MYTYAPRDWELFVSWCLDVHQLTIRHGADSSYTINDKLVVGRLPDGFSLAFKETPEEKVFGNHLRVLVSASNLMLAVLDGQHQVVKELALGEFPPPSWD